MRLLVNIGGAWLLAIVAFLAWWARREPTWIRDRDDAFLTASRTTTGLSTAMTNRAGASQAPSTHHSPSATSAAYGAAGRCR